MSCYWNVLCDKCKLYHHLGRDIVGLFHFGYCHDDEDGRYDAAEFVSHHIGHNLNAGEQLQIVTTDNVPPEYKNEEN